MSGFKNVAALAQATETGRDRACSLRKVPSQASTANWWVDLSMAAGNPLPQYYAASPLVAAALDGSRGIFHGAAVTPASLHLRELMLVTPTAAMVGRYMLLDYVMFYPFVDLDDLDTQVLDNTFTLPRFADGAGLRVMLVAAAPTTGGGTFWFTYENQNGIEQTSPTQSFSTAAATIASVLSSEPATAAGGRTFLLLAEGDTGIRKILTWTNIAPHGGLAAVVLVKPIADTVIYEINTPSVLNLVSDMLVLPPIHDDAYLNLIVQCAGSVAAGQLAGRAAFVWSQ